MQNVHTQFKYPYKVSNILTDHIYSQTLQEICQRGSSE